MNLLEVVQGLPLIDQKEITNTLRLVIETPEGEKLFNALDQIITLHVDQLGESDSALRETNAQRILISQLKFLASVEWQKRLKTANQEQVRTQRTRLR